MSSFSRWQALMSVIKYELKWNLRKLKIYIALAIVIGLSLLVTIFMANIVHIVDKQDYWYISLAFLSTWFFLLLMGAPITMNSISGEFESGTIIPLLSRPISRSEVYFGKVIASIMIILMEMVILGVILIVTSTILMGPQANLNWLIVLILTLTVSALVYAAFTMMLSSTTKNSLASILGTFGVVFGLQIGLGIYEMVYHFQNWFLAIPFIGTDILTQVTEQTFENPNAINIIYGGGSKGSTAVAMQFTNLQVSLISFTTAIAFITIFLIIGWIAFKRSDIKD